MQYNSISKLLISKTVTSYVFLTIANTMWYLQVSPQPSFYMGQRFTITMEPLVFGYMPMKWKLQDICPLPPPPPHRANLEHLTILCAWGVKNTTAKAFLGAEVANS